MGELHLPDAFNIFQKQQSCRRIVVLNLDRVSATLGQLHKVTEPLSAHLCDTNIDFNAMLIPWSMTSALFSLPRGAPVNALCQP